MALTACLICTKIFYTKPSHKKRGWGKYCSILCRNKSQLKGKIVKCFICDKDLYRSPKDLRSSGSNKFFCNKSCQTIWRNTILFSGENSTNWKHGKSAYRQILKRANRKEICTLCQTTDKRILIVHHRDRNRYNNKVENLIRLCHNCHYLVHHYNDEQEKLNKLLVSMVVVVQK